MNQDERRGLLTIGLIPLVVPFDFICSCIGLCLSSHGNLLETFRSQQYLHLSFPFEEIEWSQDDPLRLVHISALVPFSQQNALPVSDVKPAITIWKERNRYTKALKPCGN